MLYSELLLDFVLSYSVSELDKRFPALKKIKAENKVGEKGVVQRYVYWNEREDARQFVDILVTDIKQLGYNALFVMSVPDAVFYGKFYNGVRLICNYNISDGCYLMRLDVLLK